MLEDDGVSPHTAHTTNPVPLIVTEKGLKLREQGELSDLAPTLLALLGFAQPLQMSGRKTLDQSTRLVTRRYHRGHLVAATA